MTEIAGCLHAIVFSCNAINSHMASQSPKPRSFGNMLISWRLEANTRSSPRDRMSHLWRRQNEQMRRFVAASSVVVRLKTSHWEALSFTRAIGVRPGCPQQFVPPSAQERPAHRVAASGQNFGFQCAHGIGNRLPQRRHHHSVPPAYAKFFLKRW